MNRRSNSVFSFNFSSSNRLNSGVDSINSFKEFVIWQGFQFAHGNFDLFRQDHRAELHKFVRLGSAGFKDCGLAVLLPDLKKVGEKLFCKLIAATFGAPGATGIAGLELGVFRRFFAVRNRIVTHGLLFTLGRLSIGPVPFLMARIRLISAR